MATNTSFPLPIDASVPDVRAALAQQANVVLVAPPGAGKSTRLPLKLLDEAWLRRQKILLIVPRRLAAMGAARRMANELGQSVGERIGHRVRFDTRVGEATQLEVITNGVFTRMIASDPELSGVGMVMFDEVHERALAADFGLALALEAQSALRPDLRLMAMSATVDGAKFESLLKQNAPCQQVTSDGAMFAVDTHHEPTDLPAPQAVTQACMRALARFEGDGLIFLPGQREIEEVARELRKALGPGIAVHTLYGAVSRKVQEAALAADDAGRRKVVIASSIAETSLTIPGVRFVIDSGLSRRPIYDPVRGTTRLETKPASRASIDQRRGRAGRIAPGHCVRLWRREEEGGRPTQDRPEILDADLAGLRLEMAAWGAVTPDSLPFLDAPPARAWQEAGKLLTSLGALDDKYHITSLGKRMAVRRTHPRLAAMLDQADPIQASDAAWAAVVAGELTERGSVDAAERLQSALADRHQSKTLKNLHTRFLGKGRPGAPPSHESLALHLLRAYPDRVAKRQKDDGKRAIYKLAQGMQAALELYHPLAQNTLILALDLGGGRKSGAARLADIRLGLPLDEALVREVLAGQLAYVEVSQFDPQSWSEKVRQETRVGELSLAQEAHPRRVGLDAISAIGRHVHAQGISAIETADAKAKALISRYQAFFQAQGSPEALVDRLDLWLPALLQLAPAPPFAAPVIQQAFTSALSWEERQAFDQQWPATVQLGKDRKLPIAYDHPAGPAISVRPHWLYGVDVHPTFGPDGTAILIEMLSPAQRPIALTADLPAFWRAGWKDVRKDMRARYPKHPWPEEPWAV